MQVKDTHNNNYHILRNSTHKSLAILKNYCNNCISNYTIDVISDQSNCSIWG